MAVYHLASDLRYRSPRARLYVCVVLGTLAGLIGWGMSAADGSIISRLIPTLAAIAMAAALACIGQHVAPSRRPTDFSISSEGVTQTMPSGTTRSVAHVDLAGYWERPGGLVIQSVARRAMSVPRRLAGYADFKRELAVLGVRELPDDDPARVSFSRRLRLTRVLLVGALLSIPLFALDALLDDPRVFTGILVAAWLLVTSVSFVAPFRRSFSTSVWNVLAFTAIIVGAAAARWHLSGHAADVVDAGVLLTLIASIFLRDALTHRARASEPAERPHG